MTGGDFFSAPAKRRRKDASFALAAELLELGEYGFDVEVVAGLLGGRRGGLGLLLRRRGGGRRQQRRALRLGRHRPLLGRPLPFDVQLDLRAPPARLPAPPPP